MTTNETLAQYSDWAFRSAFTVLVLALVLLIVQYASTRAQAVQDRELVSAGSGARSADAPRCPVDWSSSRRNPCPSASAAWARPCSSSARC